MPPQALTPTTQCRVADDIGALPVASRSDLRTVQTIENPQPTPWSGPPEDFEELALDGDTLYARFIWRDVCASSHGCAATPSGLYHTSADGAWAYLGKGDDRVRLAAKAGKAYWVSDQPVAGAAFQFRESSAAPIARVGEVSVGATSVTGLALGEAALYSLMPFEGPARALLELRPVDSSGGLGIARPLAVLPPFAGQLRASATAMTWMDTTSLVVAGVDGRPRHVALLPEGTVHHQTQLTSRHAVALVRRDQGGHQSSYVCSLDVVSGAARVDVGPFDSIANMAANDDFIFWSSSIGADDHFVWAQPMLGGEPRTVAYSSRPIWRLVANGTTLYYFDGALRRVDVTAR
jgi:hypothetical protein